MALLKELEVKITGKLNMNNNRITNLASPTASSDAATKGYVDAAFATPQYYTSSNSGSGGSWITVCNVTGSGILYSAIASGSSYSSGYPYLYLRVTIDDVVHSASDYGYNSNYNYEIYPDGSSYSMIDPVASNHYFLRNIQFKNNLIVEVAVSDTSLTAYGRCSYGLR